MFSTEVVGCLELLSVRRGLESLNQLFIQKGVHVAFSELLPSPFGSLPEQVLRLAAGWFDAWFYLSLSLVLTAGWVRA